jgi:hypothetical protein
MPGSVILRAINDIGDKPPGTDLSYHGVWLNCHIGLSAADCKLNWIKDIQPSL